MADFYYRSQFGEGEPNWREYRVGIDMTGNKVGNRQETDTISRLIYGLSTAYHMTGEDRFLKASETGVEYLREHLRNVDTAEGVTYWYHAIEIDEPSEKKILASEFGDDYNAIPAYEQIYALVGPAQLLRINGDPTIKNDIDQTVSLFERYFYDPEYGGYWSHIDPISFDGKSDGLGRNRARKNWNSVGDHVPAYLINAWLATGEQKYADMLVSVADTIEQRFPDDEHSPFVQERFHEDWSHDTTWGWQENRAVVGHNLKIAWNLMRIHHMRPNSRYVALANKINRTMPEAGSDQQRGGWYDVVDRVRQPGQEVHRFTWHDRKAWWQQEQAILAYQIMAGSTGDEEALRLGRESASFYNAWFFDYEEGSVYFNVLATGIPYLLGTERQKGSHSMAGYHSFELAYLATVYTNLLITKEPMDLYFSPIPGALPDNILRVSPDILPPGSIRIGEVEVDGEPYADFDAEALTVRVPDGKKRVKIKVRILPSQDPFEVRTAYENEEAHLTLTGKLDMSTFGDLPGRDGGGPHQEAEAPGPDAREPRVDGQRRHPGAAVRPAADGHLRSGRHLRGRPEPGRPRGAPAGRSRPGGHQRRRELRPVPGLGRAQGQGPAGLTGRRDRRVPAQADGRLAVRVRVVVGRVDPTAAHGSPRGSWRRRASR